MSASRTSEHVEAIPDLRRTALWLGFALCAAAALLFFDFGVQRLASNDETRFPLLARDILDYGHWLVPRLNDRPHLNKPPLYAWLITILSWPRGAVTPATAALSSLLSALVVVTGTAWLGWRLFGRTAAVPAALITVTTYGVFTLGRVPMPDMALCATFVLAIAAYVEHDLSGRRGPLLAFYALVAVAFWIKGPPCLLPLAVVVAHAATRDGRAGVRRVLSVTGLAVLISMVLPWWLLAAATDSDRLVRDIVLKDLLGWYIPGGGALWHRITEPFGQALTVLLPWCVVLPLAVLAVLRVGDRRRIEQLRLPLLWIAVMFALTAVSEQQRMRYYLPLAPPAALLVAAWASATTSRRRSLGLGAFWLAAAVGLSLWQVAWTGRHNARTDLRLMASLVETAPRTLYALDAPELVFTFYLQRPVTVVPSAGAFEGRPAAGCASYLIVADRSLAAAVDHRPIRRVATAEVSGRRYSILSNECPP